MANDIKVRCTPLPSHPLGPNSDIRLDSTKLCPARPNTHHLTSGRHGVCPDLQRELVVWMPQNKEETFPRLRAATGEERAICAGQQHTCT